MRETTVRLIPKKELVFLKDDKKVIEFITNELTKGISERLIQVLEENDEIIIKKPVLRVSEYLPTDSVEYRKSVDWEPLVRCKDCKHWTPDWIDALAVAETGICAKTIKQTEDCDFCSRAERKEE